MTNEQYIRKNALIYERYKDNFNEISPFEIELFRREVEDAFETIYQHKSKTSDNLLSIQFETGQPYASVEELTSDIRNNNRMMISTDHNNSKLLPTYLNLKFRAVHDYLHYVLQAPFTAVGEIRVYEIQKKFHSTSIGKQILFSEVVLQACYAEYFGKFGKQKIVLL